MKKIVIVLGGLLLVSGVFAEPRRWQLSADTWAQPRDGQAITQMAPLVEAVSGWSQNPGKQLLIHYPGGEEGQLWAYELRSWLVALGVPLQRLEMLAGSQQADRIELELSR